MDGLLVRGVSAAVLARWRAVLSAAAAGESRMMAWIRVESSVARNQKFLKAGPAASWLWLCGLTYCQEGLTDGFIPVSALPLLGVTGTGKQSPSRLASLLVLACLWDARDDGSGWDVHDYLKHQKSAAEMRAFQHARSKAGANGGRASWGKREANAEANAEARAEAGTKARAECLAEPRSEQIRSEQIRSEQKEQTRPAPIIARRRKDAAFEGPRVYVPQRAHDDFLALRNGAERELYEWYEAVSNEWFNGVRKDEEPGADMFVFWKARYAERWPAAPSRQTPKSAQQLPSFEPWTCPHVEAHANRWRCEQATALGRPEN